MKQAEQEVTAKLGTAYPLGRVVVGLIGRGHTELGEVLMARLVKKCFWITGYWPPKRPVSVSGACLFTDSSRLLLTHRVKRTKNTKNHWVTLHRLKPSLLRNTRQECQGSWPSTPQSCRPLHSLHHKVHCLLTPSPTFHLTSDLRLHGLSLLTFSYHLLQLWNQHLFCSLLCSKLVVEI